jgi:O-antigen/teichoic acid export membrane protein
LWIISIVADTTTTGLYAAATRVATTLSYPLSVMNSVTSPYIAGAYSSDRSRAQRVLTLSGVTAAVPTLLVAVPVIVFAGWILENLLGSQYAAASPILVLLALGQVANVIGGPCGITMLMTGQQRPLSAISASTAVLGVSCGYVFGVLAGAEGVAAGFAVALALQNVLMCLVTRRRTGLRPELRPVAAIRAMASAITDGMGHHG